MGIDWMDVKGLAESIAPETAALVGGQLIARACQARWGVDVFTYDEARGAGVDARLRQWEFGAGPEDPTLGLGPEPLPKQTEASPGSK